MAKQSHWECFPCKQPQMHQNRVDTYAVVEGPLLFFQPRAISYQWICISPVCRKFPGYLALMNSDDLWSHPYDIAAITLSYGGLINSFVRHSCSSISHGRINCSPIQHKFQCGLLKSFVSHRFTIVVSYGWLTKSSNWDDKNRPHRWVSKAFDSIGINVIWMR